LACWLQGGVAEGDGARRKKKKNPRPKSLGAYDECAYNKIKLGGRAGLKIRGYKIIKKKIKSKKNILIKK